jgi:AcrR family transcriptional regulator
MSAFESPSKSSEKGAKPAAGESRSGAGPAKRWGVISRPQIVDAALRTVEGGGFESMTIRSLAAQLGVAPMSLYRHVRDKDDLLDEVVDRLLPAHGPPRRRNKDWEAWTIESADRLRKFLVAQPAALYVYLRHPMVSPAAITRMETMLAVLTEAGFADRAAHRAYAAVQSYTVGFAALQASRSGWRPADDVDPTAVELAASTTPQRFAEGLRYMLDGIKLAQPIDGPLANGTSTASIRRRR